MDIVVVVVFSSSFICFSIFSVFLSRSGSVFKKLCLCYVTWSIVVVWGFVVVAACHRIVRFLWLYSLYGMLFVFAFTPPLMSWVRGVVVVLAFVSYTSLVFVRLSSKPSSSSFSSACLC